MKAIRKSIITASLLFVSLSASAQRVNQLEEWMKGEINVHIDHGVEVTKSLGQERDIQQEGRPLIWRCDIYSFTLPKKYRYMLDEMIDTFEEYGREDSNCYGINSMSESSNGDRVGHSRRLMIGEDSNRFVTIGEDFTNFININILDTADRAKSHRYAYALEWREANKGKTDVRYTVTYAKIPSATTSIKKPQTNRTIVELADTVELDTDPVTDVVSRLHQGKPVNAADLLCNENILLIFSQLKKQFLAGQNTEFNAISIYTLCKRARECGFFSYPDPAFAEVQKAELRQLKHDIALMNVQTFDETIRIYLRMALGELEKIQ